MRPNSHYLKEFYAVAKNLINNPENLIVWVDTDTNNCLERCVLKQDKDCKYSFDQLKCLNRIYNSWLTVNNTVPVIKVSGDDLEALKNTAAELASAIDNVF